MYIYYDFVHFAKRLYIFDIKYDVHPWKSWGMTSSTFFHNVELNPFMYCISMKITVSHTRNKIAV